MWFDSTSANLPGDDAGHEGEPVIGRMPQRHVSVKEVRPGATPSWCRRRKLIHMPLRGRCQAVAQAHFLARSLEGQGMQAIRVAPASLSDTFWSDALWTSDTRCQTPERVERASQGQFDNLIGLLHHYESP